MPRKKSTSDKPLSVEQARGRIAKAVSDLRAGNDPGPITFRLKPTKKADETYPLRLTRQQRESMIHCTRIKNKIKERLKEAGDGTQVVGVTRKELDHLNDELGQAAMNAPGPDMKRLVAVLRRVADLLAEEHAEVFASESPKASKRPKKSDLSFQFKVTLLDIKPAIWRRIQVPDCTLDSLHLYIQAAFGWENCHLHQFEIGGVLHGEPDPDGDGFGPDFVDEADVLLSHLLPQSCRKARWVYEYDFGDGWRHEVLFEGFPPEEPEAKSPLCVKGKRACPPEDCGGLTGYDDYLAAVTDPRHERHADMLDWRGFELPTHKFEPSGRLWYRWPSGAHQVLKTVVAPA